MDDLKDGSVKHIRRLINDALDLGTISAEQFEATHSFLDELEKDEKRQPERQLKCDVDNSQKTQSQEDISTACIQTKQQRQE